MKRRRPRRRGFGFWVKRLGFFLTAMILLLLCGIAGALWWSLPARHAELALAGLAAPVAITLDGRGIPHIAAQSEEDAWAALGFVHARDRMFQMDMMRRGARGQTAALAGTAALRLDRFMRLLRLEERAAADLAALDAETRGALDAYARGVNAWIASRGRFAAPEFIALGAPAPWQPVDSLLWGKIMGLWLGGNWRMELERARLAELLSPEQLGDLWPEDASPGRPDEPLLPIEAKASGALRGESLNRAALVALAQHFPRFPEDAPLPEIASNAWAIGAGRSASGAPLLAADPHLSHSAPILWYLARISLPDGRRLMGATAPGVPGIVIGRNESLAWGFTTTHADTQDIFIEKLTEDGRYETPEGPRDFMWHQADIAVRGAAPVTFRFRETRHGPVLSDLDPSFAGKAGTVLALAMASLAAGETSARGLLRLNRAGSIAEARMAAEDITSPVQNLMLADRAGGIAMFIVGRVPQRRAGDGAMPRPGWDGAAAWDGFLPFEAKPHVENPISGVIVNANNRVAPADHPAFLSRDWYGDWRFRRIGAGLAAQPQHTPVDFAALQMDRFSLFAAEALLAFRALPPMEGGAGAALSLLQAWDGEMAAARPEPLIFHATLRGFGQALLARAKLPADGFAPSPEFLRPLLQGGDAAARWCGGEGCTPILAAALTEAVAKLALDHGADPRQWRWGAAHIARFDHAMLRFIPYLRDWLGLRAAPGGDGETVARAAFRGSGFAAVHGAGFRGVMDLAEADGAFAMIATGQSGHPFSRHWGDMLPLWRDGALLPLAAPREVAGRIRLTPAP
ncbi:MAG: penicillin acylase family protein [Roseomonas sp.]|nr:penicillin acylase family protein [Roseomonas sp.]MCA3326701.1 penicillin acylase family protein [Roseomonas sp.]MCA3332398.1 penicillin acylase family protein [Roseomonas sp.]MCA3336756.1 penicillin acylase family protein [Roseomonas sp.]MCA3353120.1 penicillin acylase family protein [Roseomonas sp.]